MPVWMPRDYDLRAAFQDVSEGWHSTAALHTRYNAWAKSREGKEQVSIQTFIRAMRKELCLPVSGKGHRRQWRLTADGLECRNWFQE